MHRSGFFLLLIKGERGAFGKGKGKGNGRVQLLFEASLCTDHACVAKFICDATIRAAIPLYSRTAKVGIPFQPLANIRCSYTISTLSIYINKLQLALYILSVTSLMQA